MTASQVAEIVFVNPAGFAPGVYGATMLSTGEVVTSGVLIPEPTTTLLLLGSSLALTLTLRRRLSSAG